ncbi:MAG: flavin reductase family protein [Planctomycetota bacterium]
MSESQKTNPGGVLSGERSGIGAAIGRIPSGCAILTVEHGGRSTGVLVSWVQQASFEPLSVTVGIRKGRPATELIDGSQRFLLNLIGEDPAAMFRHFGRGFSLDEDAFHGLQTKPTEYGPMLALERSEGIQACIAHLGCRVTRKIAIGDHDLYVAEVVAAASVNGAKPYTHLRSTGLSY